MAGGIPTTNLQVPTVPQPTVPQPTATPYNRQQQIGLALSALSDVFAKRDPIAGTMQRQAVLRQQQMQAEQKKKQEELNKQLNAAIEQSNLPQSQKNLLKSLNVQTKTQALMQTFEPVKEDKKTAAMINLEAYNQIKAKGTPEDIAIAERVLIGTRQNKSEEQMKKELIASLLKQTDPLGDPISEKEINDRLRLFDVLIGKTPATPINTEGSPTQIEGYNVVEVK